ncbi:MAG: UDP-galactopyranose mutase [Ferruginibacter sp.]
MANYDYLIVGAGLYIAIFALQRNAVINYTEASAKYTQQMQFKFGIQLKTVITKEYPAEWKPGLEPYYPVNDEFNKCFKKYQAMAEQEADVIFGGRLAEYKYYDMHQVIASALVTAKRTIDE